MEDVKRNQWVIVLVLAAFALMVWSGYANYKRRKQAAQRQECDGAGVAAGDKIKHADQPTTRINPVFRLARLSKSGAGIGLDHRFRIRRNRYRDNRLAKVY